ncbi:hypothetical protein VKT23_007743 [Stygiomarasmius scandens]|uniref:Uncharacterized protein n=1 Tax=Marasmiellus scandens TaxID=2682957 RepID=A0ABR1JMW6_9AGAR
MDIISEWMGYALLYESMLDSVLVAKERFLKRNGRIVVGENGEVTRECDGSFRVPYDGLCGVSEVKKESADWWNDVYGFDMSPMSTDIYNEAIIDVVGSYMLLHSYIKDLHIQALPFRSSHFFDYLCLDHHIEAVQVNPGTKKSSICLSMLPLVLRLKTAGRLSTLFHLYVVILASFGQDWPSISSPSLASRRSRSNSYHRGRMDCLRRIYQRDSRDSSERRQGHYRSQHARSKPGGIA